MTAACTPPRQERRRSSTDGSRTPAQGYMDMKAQRTLRGMTLSNKDPNAASYWQQVHSMPFTNNLHKPQIPKTPRLPPTCREDAAMEHFRGKAPPALEPASAPYQWVPVQVRVNEPAVGTSSSVNTLATFSTGSYVNSLTMHVRKDTYDDSAAHILRLDPRYFLHKFGKTWCYHLRGSVPFVILSGVVIRAGPAERRPGPPGQHLPIARLPRDLRPHQPLRFAGLSRQSTGEGCCSSKLVTLIVLPDGWLVAESGVGGIDDIPMGASIDLSAVRFCVGKGISLIDDVTLHICDLAGTRMVCLQGTLMDRYFDIHGRKPLALLPESCRLAQETNYIVPGASHGGFHFLVARPWSTFAGGGSGDLIWRDSKWTRDRISLNGIMFEVATEALFHANPMDARCVTESQVIAMMDFQKYLRRRFGTIEEAWHVAFDTDGSGGVNFTEFGLGCKASGYVGNATRLWTALDDDLSGSISLEELGQDTELLLERVRATKKKEEETQREKADEEVLRLKAASRASTRASSRASTRATLRRDSPDSRPSTRMSNHPPRAASAMR